MRYLAPLLLLFLATTTTAQVTWTRRAPASSPSPRYWHAMAFDDARGRLVLFGGRDWNAQQPSAETWEWDGATWTLRTPTTSPPPLGEHRMAYDSKRGVVVAVGVVANPLRLETWTWDGQDWTLHTPSPPVRGDGGLAYDVRRQRTVLFGGWRNGFFAETWEWDGATWLQVSTPSSPSARYQHVMVYDGNRSEVVLFGGIDDTGLRDDTWTWDGIQWTQKAPAARPLARATSAAAFDAVRDRVVMFGGVASGGILSDTWEWDGVNWVARVPSVSPPARRMHATAFDSVRNHVVLFGGGRPSFDDTWEYHATQPADYKTFGAGCSGTVGIPALAPAPGQLPWIGDSFTVELANLPPGLTSVPFGLLGLSNTTWLGNTLPFDLSIIGMKGCSLLVSPDAAVQLLNTNGSSTWTLPIPNDLVLVGGKFFQQGLVLNPGANPLGAVVSNGGAATMGAK